MNLIDAVVIEIKGEPYQAYGKWFLNCVVDGYGVLSETEIMFNDFESANNVSVGYKTLI